MSQRTSSFLVATGVAVVSVLLLVRSSHAEPPPQLETRDAKKVLEALQKDKRNPRVTAAVRWYVEVAHQETIDAPVGSEMTAVGAWGDAELYAEGTLGSCAPLSAADAAAAAKVLADFPSAMPPLLKGYTLKQQGHLALAETIFSNEAKASLPAKGCPSEHPMYSHRRVSRLTLILECLKTWSPKGDHSTTVKAIERAKSCAANNHAVG